MLSAGRGIPEAAVLSLAAGADLLCIGADKDDALVPRVQAAIVAAVTGAGSPSHDSWRRPPDRRIPRGGGVRGRTTRRGQLDGARAALRVEGDLPDLSGAEVVGAETEANIAVGEVPGVWSGRDVGPGAMERDRPVIVQVRDVHRQPATVGRRAGRAWSRGARRARTTVLFLGSARVGTPTAAAPWPSWSRSRGGEEATELGMDIGATKTLGVVVGGDGSVVAEVRVATEPGPDGVVRTAARVVGSWPARSDRTRASAWVSPASRLRAGRGLARRQPGHRRRAARAADRLADGRREVLVENDVNAAALGVAALTGLGDVAYLGIGTGLAAGIVVDGRLRRGARGVAGEVGHVPVDPAAPAAAAVSAAASRRSPRAPRSPSRGRRDEPDRARSVLAGVVAGDPRATLVWGRLADGLAQAVTLLALGVDPEVVVLGGGVAEVGEPCGSR